MVKDTLAWINSNGWIVSIFTLVLGAYLSTFLTKNKEVLMKIADKKGQYYADYINALLQFNKPIHLRAREHEIINTNRNYFYLKNLVILYGSNEVIKRLSICEKNGINFKKEEGRESYLKLIEAMKKDIENPKIIRSWWIRRIAMNNRNNNIADILFDYKQESEEE
ncbi:hypothetical protein LCY76_09520 [Fictibacillus sp. KIGAM418]|uniref:Uncharacterized protein n=1 Tax=Fictibacillus marinisediminis TaxID=2878389 RepID=A0A9X1X9R7_9BACL|nr:hypothetical protein [Fictibacillus marinisediminis]MCK6256832.1 hypothetical protein [Fictibacillus marinisediminis]